MIGGSSKSEIRFHRSRPAVVSNSIDVSVLILRENEHINYLGEYNSMNILGINSVYHESSACLIKDGKLISAVEEERFSRIKHAKESTIFNPDELPIEAISFCLKQGGIEMKDVDYIGFSMLPEERRKNKNYSDQVIEGDWGSESGEEIFYEKLLNVPIKLKEMGFKGEFKWLSHHLCHAASAYYASPFAEANIIVVDGIAETASTLIARAEKNQLKVIKEIHYPNSIGFLWEKISKYLGFSEYDACKVMGLAAYGEPNEFMDKFRELVRFMPEGAFEVDNSILKFRSNDFSSLEQFFGMPSRNFNDEMTQKYMNIASSLQELTERVVNHLAKYAFECNPTEYICLAGGTALNCVANGKLIEEGPYNNLFVPPAANDAGTSLGAALIIYHEHLGIQNRLDIDTAYLGPSFEEKEIEDILKENKVSYTYLNNIEEVIARKISEGAVVSWFQGAMEFGPRALGNRSLLADPRDPNMREKLNRIVKHREDFRPFAPSVLTEEADKWFDIKKESIASEYMLVGYSCHPEKKKEIPAVVHVDGTSRIQRVSKSKNSKYYKLIEEFFKLTDVPILLDTSFNDREPIVCSPLDAVNTFMKTKIDYLAIGNFLVSRR